MYTKSKYIPNLDGVEEIDAFVVAFLVDFLIFLSSSVILYSQNDVSRMWLLNVTYFLP